MVHNATVYTVGHVYTPTRLSEAEIVEFDAALKWLNVHWEPLMRKIERIKGICLGWRNRVGTDIDDAQKWANKGYKQPDIHIYWHTIIMLARFLNPITFKGLISLNLSLVDSVIRESQPHTDVLGLPSIALPPEDDYW